MPFIVRRLAIFVASVFMISSLAGCGMARSDFTKGAYYPTFPVGINSLDGARSDLARLLENKGSHSISVHWDMIKESSQPPLSYEDLPDFPIVVYQLYTDETGFYVFVGFHSSSNNLTSRMSIPYLAGKDDFSLSRKEADRIADDLYFIQQYFKKERERRLLRFKSEAAKYRSLAVKPPVSEEQRKYIVQANAMDRLKDYVAARDLYLKAIDVNPVSAPGAYFSLALTNAQMHRYRAAIGYMKQYLLLQPHAKYARLAQDKIYAWEIMMDKSGE